MRLNHLVVALSMAALAALSAPAAKAPKCPPGQTSVHGKCVAACPTEGTFGDPDSCECPAGFGKILTGSGGGQCGRLLCPTGAEIAAARDCDCPQNFEKHKTAKGRIRCELRQTQAK